MSKDQIERFDHQSSVVETFLVAPHFLIMEQKVNFLLNEGAQ